jgi:phage tail protein X
MNDQVTYTTKTGDMLDKVCWDYYGARAGAYEKVLAANPTLARRGPVLPAGLVLVMPDIPAQEQAGTISLWD